LITSYIALTAADPELNANGLFRKSHITKGGPSLSACNIGARISPFFHPKIQRVQNIQVSKTLYMSSEQIHLIWKPRSSSFKKDFIGIYNAEVPIENGEYVIYF
jgi:hypothetical protein